MYQFPKKITYRKILCFTFPSIIMLVVSSVYGVVDGFFVSNFAGKVPFTAVNFIFPFLTILGSFGFMFGAGGSALIGKTLGERRYEKANQTFSLIVYISILSGIVLMILGIALIRPFAVLLGASGQLLDDSVIYGQIYLLGLPGCLLQFEFQYFCATAGRPKLGLYVTVAAGLANVILDALFVAVFKWGIAGAAAASTVSQWVGGFFPLLCFIRKDRGLLHLTKTNFDSKAFLKTCTNGSSELLSNISLSFVGMLYNIQMLKYIGEDGIAAYGVLMYVNWIFLAAFIGYSVGITPLISYQYGAQNYGNLKKLLRKSIVIISISSLLMFLSGEALAKPLSVLYTGYDASLLALTLRGFFIYSFSFLFSGFAIFGSSFFTALNDGFVSASISFLRTLVFQSATVLLLPLIWKVDGIWFAIVVAEFLSATTAFIFLLVKRKKYHYF